MSDPAHMVDEIHAILAAFDWEQDDRQYALEAIERIVTTGQPGPETEPGPRTFHGVSGETLTVGHDEDGVMVRAAFHGTKLSAAGARELARHLIACADLADDWMTDAADLGEPGPANRCTAGSEPYRCILTAGHPGVHDPGPDPEGHGPDCDCRFCFDEPEPDPAEYDPGPEVDDQGGMSEYRYHEPEPWQ